MVNLARPVPPSKRIRIPDSVQFKNALSTWRDAFLAAGEASLATRPTQGEEIETKRLKAKLGEMLLERELLDTKIAALEANRPLRPRRSRP
jgi:hypothetical protein